MEEREAKRIIVKEYRKLRKEGADRSQIYLNIIALKRELNLTEYVNSLYVDVKRWIDIHFLDLAKRDFGYDVFVAEPFCKQIELFTPEKSLRLYQYLLNACEDNHAETSDVAECIKRKQFEVWRNNGSRCRIFLYKIANNFLWIALSVIVFIGLVMVCFLPAPCEWMGCLDIHFLDWPGLENQHSFGTHLFNALYYIAHGETETPMVLPLNPGGVIWVIAVECAFWGFLVNFLYQHLVGYLRRIGLNKEED